MAIPCDSTGVFLVKIFQIYQQIYGKVGVFIKSSIRETRPFNKLKKKRKFKNFIIRTRKFLNLPDTSYYIHSENNVLILKKRLHLRGRVILGPTTYMIKRKKFLRSFVRIL